MLHPASHAHTPDGLHVAVNGLTCGYDGTLVLEDVDLGIRRGDFVGLLGPSGSGKTTLLRAILGVLPFYAGDVLVDGRSARQRRPRVGYVPQLETIDWNFPVTLRQVVMMGRTGASPLMPWFRRTDHHAAQAIMDRLGINHLADRQIRDLSGGQQQRAFLARALVSNPSLLLLDEPTSGVDIKTRHEMLHLLDEINREGTTVILTTHEINAVAAHLPRVVCINRRVIGDGAPNAVFTPDVLSETYGAELHVMQHEGMTIVAEMPHRLGRHQMHDHAEPHVER